MSETTTPPEPEKLPGDDDPPLLQDPRVWFPPEPDEQHDPAGHEFPPEAVAIAEAAIEQEAPNG